jgi:hypothetical protein
MEVQEQFLPELHQAACSSGENAAANWGKLTEAAARKTGQRRSTDSEVGVRRGDGLGRGKLKLSGGMGSGERHGAVL